MWKTTAGNAASGMTPHESEIESADTAEVGVFSCVQD